MDKETLIIQKLFKIAEKQQRLLEKLAQSADPNLEYLSRVVQTAGANLNSPLMLSALVSHKVGGGYTISIDGFPPVQEGNPKDAQRDNAIKMGFQKNFEGQLQAQQRGQLLNNIALIYSNRASKGA